MFGKGSRYRNLPESTALTAQGERLRGTELRQIARLAGRFQHTVQDADRLDMLGFKYYGDPGRWWLIADANPDLEFPKDLLDRSPVVEERLVLQNQQFYDRFEDLRAALSGFGEVRVGEMTTFEGETAPREPDFIQSTVVVIYPPSTVTRQQIIAEIKARFHFVRAFAWAQGNAIAEAFTLDDQAVKSQWQAMSASLAAKPGVIDVRSAVTESTLSIAYHGGTVSRQAITAVITAGGFSILGDRSATLLRTGARIVVPPNQFT